MSGCSLVFNAQKWAALIFSFNKLIGNTHTWSSLVPLNAWCCISLKPFPYSILDKKQNTALITTRRHPLNEDVCWWSTDDAGKWDLLISHSFGSLKCRWMLRCLFPPPATYTHTCDCLLCCVYYLKEQGDVSKGRLFCPVHTSSVSGSGLHLGINIYYSIFFCISLSIFFLYIMFAFILFISAHTVYPTHVLHCQHVAGDAAEWVGWDLGDEGMIHNLPVREDTQRRGKEVVSVIM